MSWQKDLEKKIKKYLEGYTACHDFFHLTRVRDNALKIAAKVPCDTEILEAACLMHDIGFMHHEDDDWHHYKYGMEIAEKWLPEVGFPKKKIAAVLEVIKLHDNYHEGDKAEKSDKDEVRILQDADKIEMLGAIGIARLAYYFGERGFPIYTDKPVPKDEEIWLNHSLLDQIRRDPMIKWDKLHFAYSKKIARRRNLFLKRFYSEFKKELIEYHELEEK
ncbi:MAG: HD domain-containing protein [Patescibacteria group bacterium]